MKGARGRPSSNRINFAGINRNTTRRDDMAQKFNGLKEQATLALLQTKLVLLQTVKNTTYILTVLLNTRGIYQDIV